MLLLRLLNLLINIIKVILKDYDIFDIVLSPMFQ